MKILILLLMSLYSTTIYAKGGSSTGGGSDRVEKFKAYAFIYAGYLEKITPHDREKFGITVTGAELKQKIISMADNIFELRNNHNLKVTNEYGQDIATIQNGRIFENDNEKQAYFGMNNVFKPSEYVIFLSKSWKENDYSVSLKEYLRALNKQEESAAILSYLNEIDINEVKLNIRTENHKSSAIKYSRSHIESFTVEVDIQKISKCRWGKYTKLEFSKKNGHLPKGWNKNSIIYQSLKNCVASKSVTYAARLCEKSYETAKYWNQEYEYAELSKYEVISDSCKKINNKNSCIRKWKATCTYWYKGKQNMELNNLK